MESFFERLNGFLSSTVGKVPRALVLAAALLVVPTYVFPLWNLTMFAPQYQEGLSLDIYSYKLEGGNDGQDLKEINILNHYIGMRELADTDFREFQWMPFVLGILGLFFLRSAVMGRVRDVVDSFVIFAYFAAFALWSFAFKLYRYGHDLDPKAAVRVDPFMPPVFGGKQLANFEVYSYPGVGSWALLLVGLALVLALVLALRAWRKQERAHGVLSAAPVRAASAR